jgi:hypothetical protein
LRWLSFSRKLPTEPSRPAAALARVCPLPARRIRAGDGPWLVGEAGAGARAGTASVASDAPLVAPSALLRRTVGGCGRLVRKALGRLVRESCRVLLLRKEATVVDRSDHCRRRRRRRRLDGDCGSNRRRCCCCCCCSSGGDNNGCRCCGSRAAGPSAGREEEDCRRGDNQVNGQQDLRHDRVMMGLGICCEGATVGACVRDASRILGQSEDDAAAEEEDGNT